MFCTFILFAHTIPNTYLPRMPWAHSNLNFHHHDNDSQLQQKLAKIELCHKTLPFNDDGSHVLE